ncbi:cation:proton antiporter [Oleiagrimonas soli]|uniref:Kef-type K+ transport system membrane component KefB n=1 Tax=Oleiagrimonas soli TaxID=1543381 RepID=A0A841KCX7_9GAMM|nr:cation:proton antiporter [Oleiagrimonas soli]MBB6183042.1 Kef-type K+ transport system membrane component KefB [Oleiagrimonas soli]
MHHASDILLTLFIIFVAAQIGSEIAQRLKMPGVVGEIAAGCIIGPSLLGWITLDQIAPGEPLDALAEIGVVLLLFSVGLETRLEDLKKVGKSAFLVGVLGVIIPFAAGVLWAHGSGFAWVKSMFVAAAFVATSAGITARVLQELGVLRRTESRVILGAAVIDDILAMLLLGVVSSLQGGGEINVQSLLFTLLGAVGFLAIFGWAGTQMARRRSYWLDKPINSHSPLTIVLALCLGLAFLSTKFGLAAIIGAFLAGMIASETKQREILEKRTEPLLALLTPFFFVVTGAKVNLTELASWDAVWMLLVVTVIAILSKLLGGFLGSLALGKRGALIVGFGMVPRGEVGVVIAALGLAAGVFSERVYAVIVAMSLLTAVVTPPVLSMLLKRSDKEPSPPATTEGDAATSSQDHV